MSKPVDPRNFFHDGDDEPPQNVVPIKPPPREPPPTKDDNPPPHAVGPEKQILSLFLAWPETRQKLLEASITPAHFHAPGHRGLWETMMDLHEAGREIDLSSLCQHLIDRGHLDRVGGPAALADIQSYALSSASLETHLELLTRKHAARLAMERARALLKEIEESPEEVAETIQKAAEQFQALANTATTSTPILSKAYALAYDFRAPQPADEVLMTLNNAPIVSRGGLTVIQGKAKAGKSAVVASVLGAALRGRHALKSDTLGIEWSAERHSGAVIHFDTEQSPGDWWGLATRSLARSGSRNQEVIDRFISIPLVQFNIKDRLAILSAALRDQHAKRGSVDIVVIDGIADLCGDPNDGPESFEFVRFLMDLCHKYNTSIVCILHENPGTEDGKTRGHLGSELTRKAFANLRVDKDAESVSTLYGTLMRKQDIPKSMGVCFAWNEEEKMHTTIGSARDIEKDRNSEKSQRARDRRMDEAMAGLEDIFGDSESMLYSELWPAVMDRFACKERWAKNKISDWMKAKILTKNAKDEYIFNQ